MEEIEATGIPAFLAEHPPFAGLDRQVLVNVAATALVEFFPEGDEILTELGEPARHVYIVRKGAVELTIGGKTVDLLHEGEMFGHPSVLSGRPPSLGARAHEDVICLLLPPETIFEVFGTRGGLGFLISSIRRRSYHLGPPPALRAITVRSVLRRPAVEVGEDEPVASVARIMSANDVTGVVVTGESGAGIVTDRDLRERVLGAGLTGETPVGGVSTRPVRFAGPDDLVDDVLIEMLDQGVRHLPIRSEGRYMGMLEVTDIVSIGLLDPFDLRASIETATSVESLVALSQRIPNTVAAAIDAGVGAPQLGRMVASFTDSLTAAALGLAMGDIGPEPVPWAWVALGSQARREQGLITDQDHTLFYAEGGAVHDAWFADLADRVVTTLEACGIPRCPSGVMASEAKWRAETRARVEEIKHATWEHDRGAALFAGIALDHRQIAGDLDVTAGLEEIRRAATANHGFVVRSGELAVAQQIPIGFFGNLVVRDIGDHQGVLNIKSGGIHPVIELGRFFALRSDSAAVGTIERVRHASRAGVLDEEDAEGLVEAFALLVEVRLRHQVDNWRKGAPPDNLIDPVTLGPLARAQLKDAFGIIREVQRQVAREIAPHAR